MDFHFEMVVKLFWLFLRPFAVTGEKNYEVAPAQIPPLTANARFTGKKVVLLAVELRLCPLSEIDSKRRQLTTKSNYDHWDVTIITGGKWTNTT